jgi:hypothetical protein
MLIKIGSHAISERALYRRITAKLSSKQFGSIIREIEKDIDNEFKCYKKKKEVLHGHK